MAEIKCEKNKAGLWVSLLQKCELGTMKSVGQAGRGAESERLRRGWGEAERLRRGWREAVGAATNHKQDEVIREKTPWLKRKNKGENHYREWSGQSVEKDKQTKAQRKKVMGPWKRQWVQYLCLATFRDTPSFHYSHIDLPKSMFQKGLTWVGLSSLEP